MRDIAGHRIDESIAEVNDNFIGIHRFEIECDIERQTTLERIEAERCKRHFAYGDIFGNDIIASQIVCHGKRNGIIAGGGVIMRQRSE